VIEAQRADPAEVARVFAALTAAMRHAVDDGRLDDAACALDGSAPMPRFDSVEAILHEHVEIAARWVTALEDALGAVEEAARRASLRRFEPAAWPMRRNALADAFELGPDSAVSKWIASYADALAHWQLEFCERLAAEPFALPPRAAHLHDLLQTATAAIREERFGDAEPLLEYLVDPSDGYVLPLADETRALLLVMLGRIEIYDVEQPAEGVVARRVGSNDRVLDTGDKLLVGEALDVGRVDVVVVLDVQQRRHPGGLHETGDAGGDAWMHYAIDQADRAVKELVG